MSSELSCLTSQEFLPKLDPLSTRSFSCTPFSFFFGSSSFLCGNGLLIFDCGGCRRQRHHRRIQIFL
jgi:hypothetical protein